MNKTFLSIAVLVLCVSPHLRAASTIQFNSGSAKATGFDNFAGNATGGLSYGIVMDTTGNGFSGSGSNYDSFTMPATSSGLYLSRASDSSVTDDFFFWNGQTTLATISGTDGGTNGLSTTFGNIPNGTNGITAGDAFAIVWFDSGSATGNKYGFLTDPLFVVPSDSFTVSVASASALANVSSYSPSNTLGAVPEPSRMMLLGLGLIGVFFRRRR